MAGRNLRGVFSQVELDAKSRAILANAARYTVFEHMEQQGLSREMVRYILRKGRAQAKPAGTRIGPGPRQVGVLSPEKRAELRAWRIARGYTQERLAFLAGIGSRTLQGIEAGRLPCTDRLLGQILDALG